MITVGHHPLRFVDGEGDEPEDEFEKTMVIGPRGSCASAGPGLGCSGGRRSAAGAAATAARASLPRPRQLRAAGSMQASQLRKAKLQVLSGQFAGRELELIKTLTTLGRPGVQVAAITRRADGYFIVHVDSGKENDFPLVNGAPIGQQARRCTTTT